MSANSVQCGSYPALSRTLPAKLRKPVTSLVYEGQGSRPTSSFSFSKENPDSGICSPIQELESDVDVPSAASRSCGPLELRELSASLALLETESTVDTVASDCDMSASTESKIAHSSASSNVLQTNRQRSNSTSTPIPFARTKAAKKKLSLNRKKECFPNDDIPSNNAALMYALLQYHMMKLYTTSSNKLVCLKRAFHVAYYCYSLKL